ncbi:methyltransferase, FkbM family [Tropicimonas sediminicola]|uniref:Methyltransferase, FkbM family n=2 Tax=Tropicimonas sediminicola TaxID=1031541 RepID=A0A239M244_9RHOB|nr:methyltransferase, FkbM family [Tropicimonas sediminicola]
MAQLRFPVEDFPITGLGTLEPANKLAGFSSIEQVDVETRRLDSFDIRDLGFIKIDVEGHELEVLQGGKETLARETPVLLIEIEERHRPDALETVSDFLAGFGYGSPRQALSRQNYVFRSLA